MNVPVGLLTHNATQTRTTSTQKHDIENLQCRAIFLASVENQNAFFLVFLISNSNVIIPYLTPQKPFLFVLLAFLRGVGDEGSR